MVETERLPLNFHQTFIPERRYLSSLLLLVSSGTSDSDDELSEKTGIPMGKSSGKLRATLEYAKGMGLIEVKNKKQRVISLSNLGTALRKEDPYLNEANSQILMHLELTRKDTGADLWFNIFVHAPQILGPRFKQSQLSVFLEKIYGKSKRSLIGPVLRTYQEPASLCLVDMLEVGDGSDPEIHIKPAPLLDRYREIYAFLLLCIWENSSCAMNSNQITIDIINEETEIQSQLNLNNRQFDHFLSLIQNCKAIEIDKQMNPWILTKKSESTVFVKRLFESI